METQWLSSTERVMVEGAESPLQAISHGRWGVAQRCNCRSILGAIATLIEALRPDLAMVLIEKELNSET